MKLKCDKHDRRVLTTPRGFEHRTDDQSVCESDTASIGNKTYAIDLHGDIHLAFVDGQPAFDLTRR